MTFDGSSRYSQKSMLTIVSGSGNLLPPGGSNQRRNATPNLEWIGLCESNQTFAILFSPKLNSDTNSRVSADDELLVVAVANATGGPPQGSWSSAKGEGPKRYIG